MPRRRTRFVQVAFLRSPVVRIPIIWCVDERDGLDVYRVTKRSLVIGEYAGRSIGPTVFQAALKYTDPGRSVWLKDERQFRQLGPASDELHKR